MIPSKDGRLVKIARTRLLEEYYIMAYRQTTTQRPTEEQFRELFDLQVNTFWEHQAYTWYDPKLTFETPEEFRDAIVEWSLENTESTRCGGKMTLC